MGKMKNPAPAPVGGRRLPELTARLMREDPERAQELLDGLPLEQRVEAALARSGKERMELILLSEQSQALTRLLPAEEWWRTLKEVGEEDALPLVAMASNSQITYLVDLEWWFKDILDPLMVIRWWVLFMEAGPEVLIRWFESADEELLILSLSKFIQVYTADPDDSGNEPWRALRLWTLDDNYYLHFRDQNLAPHLEQVLRLVRDRFQDRYYSILDRVRTCVPAEEEDTADRLRRGRLLDHGFPEFDEALAVYAYLGPEQMRALEKKRGRRSGKEEKLSDAPAPRYDLVKGELPLLLGRALASIEDPAVLEEFRFEFARLANRVLVADAAEISRLENLGAAVEKVCGYLEIGLEVWSEGDLDRASGILQQQWLTHVFQAGYSQALRLHRQAQRLEREGWLRQAENPYALLDEPTGPILEGALKKRPLCYAGLDGKGGKNFREFQNLFEVRRAEQAVSQAEFLGRLFFEALGLTPDDLLELERHAVAGATFSALFLTALVRGALDRRFAFAPLAAEDLPRIMTEILTAVPPRQVRPELLEVWAQWLERRLENLDPGLVPEGRAFLDQCLKRFQEEFGTLKAKSPDPRFLATLIVSRGQTES